MQIQPPVFRSLVEGLKQVFQENQYADRVLETQFKKNRKFGSRDRRALAETFYDLVRNWRLAAKWANESEANYFEIAQKFSETNLSWPEIRQKCKSEPWSVRESYPEQILEHLKRERPEDYELVFAAMNVVAPVYLRVNSLKSNINQVRKSLEQADIGCNEVKNVPSAVILNERKNVFQTEAFKSGWFEVQDAGSQLIAPFLEVKPGDRVIDACAGAGGKSLHLADLMNNKGKILALDIHAWKLKELGERARRAGADIIEVRPIESTKVIKRLAGSADKLLLDVPCSGSGVLRRQPDTKWKWNVEDFNKTLLVQKQILDQYEAMLKVGGTLVYATCSVFPSENQQQIRDFIKRTGDRFELKEELEVLPHISSFDGFYAAKLIKKS